MSLFWNTLLTNAAATTAAALLAFAAARMRFSVPRGFRTALDILFLLPLALPSIAFGFIAAQELRLLITIGDNVATLPLYYLCAWMGFRKVRLECIDAARLQGLGTCGIFWRVWFPVAWPWLAAGLALGILRSVLLIALVYA